MLKSELTRTLELARDHNESLLDVDHSPLFGLYLPSFKQVTTTVRTVARLLRETVVRFDGSVDETELEQFGRVARHRLLIVG